MTSAAQRILLLARSLQMGGVERNTVNLANTLSAQGHEVHILIFKDRRDLTPDPAVKVHLFDIDKFNRYTIIGLIYDLITRGILRLVVPRSTFFWRGLVGGWYFRWWLARLERRAGSVDKIVARGQGAFENIWSFSDRRYYEVVVSPHGAPRGSWLEKIYTRAIYGGKQLVVNSSGTEASVRERLAAYDVAAASITLIPNPIPVKRIALLAQEAAPIPATPYLVHVARLTYQKNQELLIRAFHAAKIDAKLVIVGSGQDEDVLRKLVAELGMTNEILFVGQQKNPYPWMKHAKLFVLSSRLEGFGLVMAESLVCGTPVVAVDCPGGVRDVLIEEQAAFIADPTVEGLATKIRAALAHPVTIKPEWYLRFDADVIARQFLALP